MSSVQPEDGLPVRRVVTADSFRALKFKLSGAKLPPPLPPAPVPPDPAPIHPGVETRSEPFEPALPQFSPAATVEAAAEPVPEPIEAVALHEPEPPEAAIVTEPPPAIVAEAAEPQTTEAPDAQLAPAEPEATPESPVSVPDGPVVELADAEPPVPPPFSEAPVAPIHVDLASPNFVERRILESSQREDPEAGERAHALLDIMAVPTSGSLPQERALANDTLLRLIPRMPLKRLRHLAERVCLMEAPSQMLVRRLINDPRIEVSGPLLENAMTVDDSDLIAVVSSGNPAKLRLLARRRIISPALSEALIGSNHVETLLNLVRNQGATFSIESMWRLTRFAADHPVLQAPLVTRQDTPSPIAFQLFWRLPSELRRYVLSRFLTDSETISRILTMNAENEGIERKYADLSLLSRLEEAAPQEQGAIYAALVHVSEETGARIAEDKGGEALTVALKAAGLTRTQFAGVVDKRPDAEALKAIFDTLSFNKARVLLTYWDWAARRTGPYARIAAA